MCLPLQQLVIFSLLSLIGCSKMVKIESYNVVTASVCIAVPAAGQSYRAALQALNKTMQDNTDKLTPVPTTHDRSRQSVARYLGNNNVNRGLPYVQSDTARRNQNGYSLNLRIFSTDNGITRMDQGLSNDMPFTGKYNTQSNARYRRHSSILIPNSYENSTHNKQQSEDVIDDETMDVTEDKDRDTIESKARHSINENSRYNVENKAKHNTQDKPRYKDHNRYKRDVANNKWLHIRHNQKKASLHYYVSNNYTGLIYWAGQTAIPGHLLTPGSHILTYEMRIVQRSKLSVLVWLDAELLQFRGSSNRQLTAPTYTPHHVTLYGPPSLRRAVLALCHGQEDLTAAIRKADYSSAATVGIVTSSIIFALLALVGLFVAFTWHRNRTGRPFLGPPIKEPSHTDQPSEGFHELVEDRQASQRDNLI